MKPKREPSTRNGQTYFVTSATSDRRPFFRHESWATLFLETLLHYRAQSFQLYEFVLMPDHFHLIITPSESLEKAMQLIKGVFSRRASLQLKTKYVVWQRGFTDHRIRDVEDYDKHKSYCRLNPVRAGLCELPTDYPYSSAYHGYELDPFPQGLKPIFVEGNGGTAEAVPFQGRKSSIEGSESAPRGSKSSLHGLKISLDRTRAALDFDRNIARKA